MIGVYDSGVGGLAVFDLLRARLPDADLLYLADQANAPYGELPLAEIGELAEAAVARLIAEAVETVVVACNTASAAALHRLRSRHPATEIVGMEPAVKPAAGSTRSGVVGVLATPATFEAPGYAELIGRFAAGATVLAHPCPGWAAAVETGWPSAEATAAIRDHLLPLFDAGADTLVLACTHYSFLAETIAEVAGPGVTVVDPSPAVVRQAARVATGTGSGLTRYSTTGDAVRFGGQIERLLGRSVRVEGA